MYGVLQEANASIGPKMSSILMHGRTEENQEKGMNEWYGTKSGVGKKEMYGVRGKRRKEEIKEERKEERKDGKRKGERKEVKKGGGKRIGKEGRNGNRKRKRIGLKGRKWKGMKWDGKGKDGKGRMGK